MSIGRPESVAMKAWRAGTRASCTRTVSLEGYLAPMVLYFDYRRSSQLTASTSNEAQGRKKETSQEAELDQAAK